VRSCRSGPGALLAVAQIPTQAHSGPVANSPRELVKPEFLFLWRSAPLRTAFRKTHLTSTKENVSKGLYFPDSFRVYASRGNSSCFKVTIIRELSHAEVIPLFFTIYPKQVPLSSLKEPCYGFRSFNVYASGAKPHRSAVARRWGNRTRRLEIAPTRMAENVLAGAQGFFHGLIDELDVSRHSPGRGQIVYFASQCW